MKRSSFICEESHVFIEEGNPSNQVVTIEEGLDAVEVDDIGNLVIYLGQFSSIKNGEILKQSLMVDSLLEIITERGSQKLYKPIEVHSLISATEEIVVGMIFLVDTFFVSW